MTIMTCPTCGAIYCDDCEMCVCEAQGRIVVDSLARIRGLAGQWKRGKAEANLKEIWAVAEEALQGIGYDEDEDA